jgi:hypothetical protein
MSNTSVSERIASGVGLSVAQFGEPGVVGVEMVVADLCFTVTNEVYLHPLIVPAPSPVCV